MTSAVSTLVQQKSAHAYRELQHLPALDGLRGIAIALVLWYHAPHLFLNRAPSSWFWNLSIGGWIGVDLFFVVSGFLITTILLRMKNSERHLQTFWFRRALRILPLAYLYLAVLLGNVLLGDPTGALGSFTEWPWYFFYLGNLHIALSGFQPLVIMLLWSLAVEEQFYLFWPFAVNSFNARWLFGLCMLTLVASPVIRGMMPRYPEVYVFTFCRIDTLAAGSILGLCYSREELRTRAISWCNRLFPVAILAVVLALVVPFGPSIARPWYFAVFGYSWVAAAFAIIVGASVEPRRLVLSVLTTPVLVYLGRISYGLYIWHCLVGCAVKKLNAAGLSSMLGFNRLVVLWLACLLIVATISWLTFEKPILNLRRKVIGR